MHYDETAPPTEYVTAEEWLEHDHADYCRECWMEWCECDD